jgi:hypothetical protein
MTDLTKEDEGMSNSTADNRLVTVVTVTARLWVHYKSGRASDR